jgi:NhaP-type Na+/H+ or K+/H+ antiporter
MHIVVFALSALCTVFVIVALAVPLAKASRLPLPVALAAPMTVAQKTLICWGGVRGAVTLILALSLAEISALSDDDTRVISAVAAGFVFATLLLNASTLTLVTRRLGLDRLSDSDRRCASGSSPERSPTFAPMWNGSPPAGGSPRMPSTGCTPNMRTTFGALSISRRKSASISASA